MSRRAVALLVCGSALLPLVTPRPGQAQDVSATASALFEQGKELLGQGKTAEACVKLAESHRLDPGGAVVMLLATCREKEGKVASAWAAYKEALAMATQAARADRQQYARERIEALTPRLSYLNLSVAPAARVEGLVVRRGEITLGEATWGVELPVDPGVYLIRATAPGREPFEQSVDIKESAHHTVTVVLATTTPPVASSAASAQAPAAPASAPVGLPPPPPPSPRRSTARSTAGYVSAGLGVVAIGVGGFFGLRAIQKRRDSDAGCPGGACTREAWDTYGEGKTAARVANVGLGVGLVGLGVGAFLLLGPVAGDSPALAVAAGPGGVSVRGGW
jgi:hypothetical protein